MLCKKCGQKLSVNDDFCPMCGSRINVKHYKKTKRILFFLPVIVLIVLGIVTLLIIFYKKNNNTDDEADYISETTENNESGLENTKLNDKLIGISYPVEKPGTELVLRKWNETISAHNIETALKTKGYEVDLQFYNTRNEQYKQLEQMINEGCRVIIYNGYSYTPHFEVIKKAKSLGISIIENWEFTYSNRLKGELQAKYIIDKLKLDNTTNQYNIFLGDSGDEIKEGALEILKPYIDRGILIYNTTVDYNNPEVIDIILDGGSNIIDILEEKGIDKRPFRTCSYHASLDTVKDIINGDLEMCIWDDPKAMEDGIVSVVERIVNGETVEISATNKYECEPVVIDKDNYNILLDSGYYSQKQWDYYFDESDDWN